MEEEQSTALVKFGVGVLTRGGGLEDLDNDRKIVAITRAVMDAMPQLASELLQRTTDVRAAIESLLGWINYLKSDQVAQLSKLRGLIDSLAQGGQLAELLKQIKHASESGENAEKGSYLNNTFLELTAADTDRLKLLYEAAKGDVELTKALLRIRGAIIRPMPGQRMNDVTSFFAHGLLRATAHFGNKEATALLLKATEESSMATEMLLKDSLIDTFGSAARHGDAATLKTIVTLARKAEEENTVVQSGEKTYTTAEVVECYRKSFELPDEANVSAVLLIGRNLGSGGLSNLAMAIESGDEETIKFISELLTEDPELLRVVGQVLHGPLEMHSRVMSQIRSMRKPAAEDAADGYQVPASLSTRVETISDLPAEYDHECYLELTRLMNFLDHMSQASGRGAEWARRLTILFNDVQAAKDYLRASMKWAMDNKGNPTVWQHRTNRDNINWPEDMPVDSPDHIEEIDALEVAMGFDFPSGAFNAVPWRNLLINYPETARYIGLALEIEAYLTRQSQPFPTTINDLRAVVLEVDIQKCGFSNDVAQKLRACLDFRDVVSSEDLKEKRGLRSGVLLAATVPPTVKDCMRRLAVMGVLHHTAATHFGEWLYNRHPVDVVVEDGNTRYATHDHYDDKPEPGSVQWRTENYQTILPFDASLGELAIVTDVLNDVKAIPCAGCVTLDMREMDEIRKTEFVKQLCIAIARMLPSQRIKGLVCPISPLSKKTRLTPDQVVGAILSSRSIEEAFETYFSNNAPIKFFRDDAQFEFRFPKFTSNLVTTAFGDVHEFANWCLSLIDANQGKARDIKADALEDASGHKKLVEGLGKE